MKKSILYFTSIILMLTFAYCTPKVTITKTSTDVHVPTLGQSFTADQIQAGMTLTSQKCGKCHKLYDNNSFTVEEWNPILDKMIPKARLQGDDATLVKAYILSGAKKS